MLRENMGLSDPAAAPRNQAVKVSDSVSCLKLSEMRGIDFQHNRFDFVAFLQDFGRMVDLAGPRNIQDVDHAIETISQLFI
jgi:hypothetical protein